MAIKKKSTKADRETLFVCTESYATGHGVVLKGTTVGADDQRRKQHPEFFTEVVAGGKRSVALDSLVTADGRSVRRGERLVEGDPLLDAYPWQFTSDDVPEHLWPSPRDIAMLRSKGGAPYA